MSKKLGMGDTFPNLTISLVNGGTIDLPGGMGSKYGVILFYRGHWWPYCRRQLAGFEKLKADLDAVGARVFAASVDPVDKAGEVAAEVSFPVGYGVTREIADKLGSWWEERRSIVQPSEFIIDASGKVLTASYSDGPLGRIDAADVIKFINFREAQSRK